jgi:hypothetical protein
MRGTILGFDGTSGAINGEDGVRYAFSAADWKGPQPAKARDSVDFVASGTTATDVYPVKASILSGAGGTGGGIDLGGQDAKTFIAERPQIILEALAIIVSLLIPMVSAGFIAWSAVSYPSMLGMADSFGVGGAGLTLMHILSFAIWLIPVGGAYALFLEFTKARNAKVELIVGALCLGAIVLHFLVCAMSNGVGSFFSTLGFGAYLLILIGIGLIMTATGRLSRVPGM